MPDIDSNVVANKFVSLFPLQDDPEELLHYAFSDITNYHRPSTTLPRCPLEAGCLDCTLLLSVAMSLGLNDLLRSRPLSHRSGLIPAQFPWLLPLLLLSGL